MREWSEYHVRRRQPPRLSRNALLLLAAILAVALLASWLGRREREQQTMPTMRGFQKTIPVELPPGGITVPPGQSVDVILEFDADGRPSMRVANEGEAI